MKVNDNYELVSKSGRDWKIRTYKLDGVYYTDILWRQNKPDFTFYSTKIDYTKEELFKRVESVKNYLYNKDLY